MKSTLIVGGKWIVIAGLGLLLGLLLLAGLGRRRGTRLYRLRMGVWSLILGLTAAGGFLVLSTMSGCRTCYKPMPPPDDPNQNVQQHEHGGTSGTVGDQDEDENGGGWDKGTADDEGTVEGENPVEPDQPLDPQPMCYAPMPTPQPGPGPEPSEGG